MHRLPLFLGIVGVPQVHRALVSCFGHAVLAGVTTTSGSGLTKWPRQQSENNGARADGNGRRRVFGGRAAVRGSR
jgi:hypothetical protein